jgi:hypothetical protein
MKKTIGGALAIIGFVFLLAAIWLDSVWVECLSTGVLLVATGAVTANWGEKPDAKVRR